MTLKRCETCNSYEKLVETTAYNDTLLNMIIDISKHYTRLLDELQSLKDNEKNDLNRNYRYESSFNDEELPF